MPLFSQSILYFFLLFSISFAHYSEFGNQCFGENCENPQYLEDTPHCIGLECESKESLISMISDLQKEKHAEYLKPVQNPSLVNRHSALDILTGQTTSSFSSQQCSICNRTDLCINNGICVPDVINPWKNYYCICPDNTSGRNCQKIICCNPNPCGKNADCYVANHQINCICKPGYTASHNGRNCDLKVIESCLTGDPHYTTYDNLHFDYQGTCPYVFSQPCSILPSPFLWFSVRAKNELLSRGSHISQVSEVEVDLHNITIHIDQRSKFVLVNGVQVLLPFFYPNKSYWIVRIKFTGSKYMIQNDQGITVTFTTSGTLCVEVPNIPEFQGPNTLCGLAGNIDGKWSDDVVNRNGSVLPITSSRQPNKNNNFVFNQAEDSWITDQFLVLRPNQENCINGQVLDNTTNCDSQAAVDACAPIKQAESSTGPFAVCSALGSELIDNYYYNCVFDVCISQNYKCTSLSNFLHFCQQALPGVVQDPNWREEVNCPLACPPHSHHELCVSSCPSTCADPFPEQCDQGCVDGCTCDPGYIIDNSISGILKCITIDKCGCLDENGNIHQPNSPWLTQNCTIYHECRNGTMYSEYRPCSELAQCIDSSFYAQCKCDVGYRGDGYNCTDINECVETPGICGHGTCTNLPGTYHCHCNDYWLGTNCNQYKPRRHCADLYVYWGNRTSGVYSLNPAYTLPNRAPFEPFDVYCEMSIDGGGFTLISSDTDNLNSNKTYSDYLTGFGDPNLQKVWIGLEFIHQLTIQHSQTLRLNIHRCASNGRPERTTDCTYPTFVVLNATNQYAVVIRQPCDGTEAGPNYYEDGWARWDLSKDGPKFSTWDIEDGVDVKVLSNKVNNDAYRYSCSKSNFNTGWWYVNDQLCGAANLNGVRYQCPSIPVESEKYLRWSEGTIQQSWMYLRPVGYPNYDIHP